MSDRLLKKAKAAVSREHMLAPGDTVLVALSGGADSVALLRFFLEEREELGLRRIAAAHLNHGLRGEEAHRDEQFVRRLCARWQIPLSVRREPVGQLAAEQSLGLEEAGRLARYAFLESEAARWERETGGPVKIATAHTLSDSMETALLCLARGCGLDGLLGIPPVRGRIVRPLTDCTRAEVEAFCAARDLPFVTDSTNSDCRYSRNRIRSRVIPELTRLNPRLDEAFARLFCLLRQDAARLDGEAEELYRRAYTGEGLRAAPLQAAPAALRSRALHRFVEECAGQDGGRQRVAEIEEMLEGCRRGVSLPGGCVLRLKNGCLAPEPAVSGSGARFGEGEEGELRPGEAFLFAGRTWRSRLLTGREYARLLSFCREKVKKIYKIVLTNAVNYDMITSSIYVRARLPGDRLHPAGRGVGKSLKKLFNEAKIPVDERSRLPVFCDSQGPLLAVNVAADERVRVTPDTRLVLLVLEERLLSTEDGSKYASFFEEIGER